MKQIPIGFFQLFHTQMGFKYPDHLPDAGGSDIFFACQWLLQKNLENIYAIHLPVINGLSKENWAGRTTSSIIDFLDGD